MRGAIYAVVSDECKSGRAIQYIQKAIGVCYITVFNDGPSRTHAQVLAAFDRAIELSKEAA